MPLIQVVIAVILIVALIATASMAAKRDKFPGRRQGGGTYNTEELEETREEN